MTGFLSAFLLGALVALVFDWVAAYLMNPWRLETPKERRQATLLAFAWHGPWMALGAPLVISGEIARRLEWIGVAKDISGFPSLLVFGAIGGAVTWLAHQLPPVRAASAAVGEKMRVAHAANNSSFTRWLRMPSQSAPDDR